LVKLGKLHETAPGAEMTDTVNIYDAKTHLSKLVDRAAAGEEISSGPADANSVSIDSALIGRRAQPRQHGVANYGVAA
jgi:hypothetical protein